MIVVIFVLIVGVVGLCGWLRGKRETQWRGLMRDPGRIDDLCARLAAAWKRAPQMRLGQIVIKAADSCTTNPFYLEDDSLVTAIERLLEGNP